MLIPDRFPSLIVLVGFWIPPAIAGWVAAWSLQRSATRAKVTYAVLALFVLGYAAAWFLFNLRRMPPSGTDSLNLAVAGSLLLYAVFRSTNA